MQTFALSIREEFTKKSAINSDLFEKAIEFIPDVEYDPITKEVTATPIAEVLGWNFTRFGHQANDKEAALFLDHDRKVWQAKVFDRKKPENGRTGRYFAPKGNGGDRAYFPPVPDKIAAIVADRYGVDSPEPSENFWEWLLANPSIPLTITEGGKKALALLSAGIPAIALYGCLCGAKNHDLAKGVKWKPLELIPELIPYAEKRQIIIAFDRDTKPKAKRDVGKGIHRLSRAIVKAKGTSRVALWDVSEGKGIDDVAAAHGYERVREIIDGAIDYKKWANRELTDLSPLVSKRVNQQFLILEALEIPPTAQIIGLKSPKGTGKTEILSKIIKNRPDGIPCYPIGHRVTLQRELCDGLGLRYRTDDGKDANLEKAYLGYGLCIDSLHPFANPRVDPDDPKFEGAWIVLDEVEQLIWHLLSSGTCLDTRSAILETFRQLLQNVIETGGKIFIADADLSRISIEFIRTVIGEEIESYIVENVYERDKKRPLHVLEKPSEAVANAVGLLEAGKKVFIVTGSQKVDSRFGSTNIESYLCELFPDLAFLRADQETVSDPTHPAYRCAEVYRDDKGNIIRNLTSLVEKYDCVIVSPTLETGVSIVTEHFDAVIGIACGTQTVNGFCQSLERVRADIPRYVYAPERHVIGRVGDGSDSPYSLLKGNKKKSEIIFKQLAEADAVESLDGGLPVLTATWAKYGSIINAQSEYYREAIVYKLVSEGYESRPVPFHGIGFEAVGDEMTKTRDRNWDAKASEIAATEPPTEPAYQNLKQKKEKTRSERLTERKGDLRKKYLTEDITPEMVKRDDRGWFGQLTLHYFLTTGKPFLNERDREKIRSIGEKNKGKVFSPDASERCLSPVIFALENMGIPEMLDFEREFTVLNLREWYDRLLPYRGDIKRILGVGISEKISPIRGFASILSRLGLKLSYVERVGDRENRHRVYRIQRPDDDREHIFSRWFDRDKDKFDCTVRVHEIDNIYITQNKNLVDKQNPDPVSGGRSVGVREIGIDKISSETEVKLKKAKIDPLKIGRLFSRLTARPDTYSEKDIAANPEFLPYIGLSDRETGQIFARRFAGLEWCQIEATIESFPIFLAEKILRGLLVASKVS